MKLTIEQEAIVSTEVRGGLALAVDAFAGSGKTSTLEAYALARPDIRFHYVAFNRAIKEEAQARFPSNVKCVTSHGLAFGQFGVQYQHKIEMGRLREAVIAQVFGCTYLSAKTAIDTLTNFLCSADLQIHERHISKGCLPGAQTTALDLAVQIWQRMQDPGDNSVFMVHDGYLKLYQLSNPLIRSGIIMIDEFQDSNSVVVDIITRQSSGKIYVGDENQAIYSFRGAFNALARVKADKRLALTSSFRFGPGVASLATLLLRDWKGESRTIHGAGQHQTVFDVNLNAPHARIGRTNSGLFEAAISLADSGTPFGYVGGIGGYRLDMIRDAYNLKSRRGRVSDPFMASFGSFGDLKDYADSVDDKELKMLAKVVGDYGDAIPHYIDQIKAAALPVLTGREVALSTVHKSKGLEFDSVVLLDDFAELKIEKDGTGNEEWPSDEEINLLYVASTRAERCLRINSSISDWLIELQMDEAVHKGDIGSFKSKKKHGSRFPVRSKPADAAASQPKTISMPSARRETRQQRILKSSAPARTGELFA